ncbi:unnamed protein product [Arctia plantaginis]|uniref:Chitin-binding type-2 domain-containing protein n=1 Tax=Arctia plantaginis TaxID=874455 RepID=A0A8S1ADQ2_ARCPL|nr:unnamed protein product [Arctia plantaginis]
MRRQARISAGGALVVRTASALQVWLWLLIFIFQNEFRISRSIQPGYLDFDNLPETNFTCEGKVIGGYYADLETSCQMFHVCTVGQHEEPMDIKFLCLNGTVFDQETRVCERVDEVDCTKSEKFYSLNLELYGSTVPPIIQPDQQKNQTQPTEQSQQQTKPNQEADPSIGDTPTTTQNKFQSHATDPTDSTEDPIQEVKNDDPRNSSHTQHSRPPLTAPENEELTEEYQDDEYVEYEDYAPQQSPSTTQSTSTTTTTTTTTTTLRPRTTTIVPSTSSHLLSPNKYAISSPSPIPSSLSPSSPTFPPSQPYVHSGPSELSAPSGPSAPSVPSAPSSPTLDPSLLSPQEFIYQHRGPGSEAISFSRPNYRPADGVYITHAPPSPQQFDHFPYESSRTAPRPAAPRPTSFVQRPHPFRPTTIDPRDQLLRPGPTSQPSERYETSVRQQNRPQTHSQSLPAQRPLPFNPFYYDRKRSDDSSKETESTLSARSVAPPNVTEKPKIKLKSPPRVIVTASASVSDSNGKRLNYTVGNVVSAVKPIVAINYDDYKESDLIFDPFFLDVPKLQKRRKTRSNINKNIFTVPSTITVASKLPSQEITSTTSPVTSRATTTHRLSSTPAITTTTAVWNPNDYVDDNYEPHAYIPPIPPFAVLVPHELNKYKKYETQTKSDLVEDKTHRDYKSNVDNAEQPRPTSTSTEQTTSSHSAGAGQAPPTASPPPPPLLEAPTCATSRSTDCRTRA